MSCLRCAFSDNADSRKQPAVKLHSKLCQVKRLPHILLYGITLPCCGSTLGDWLSVSLLRVAQNVAISLVCVKSAGSRNDPSGLPVCCLVGRRTTSNCRPNDVHALPGRHT